MIRNLLIAKIVFFVAHMNLYAQPIEYYYSKQHSDTTIKYVKETCTDSLTLMFIDNIQFTFRYDSLTFHTYFVRNGIFEYDSLVYSVDTINQAGVYRLHWPDAKLVHKKNFPEENIRLKKLKILRP